MGFAARWLGCVAFVCLASCSAGESSSGAEDQVPSVTRAVGVEEVQIAASTGQDRPRIVVLGDSLTAGLGLPSQHAYPSLLQERLDAAGLNFEVVNAGVSGDTSAGGLSRLDWALEGDVRILLVALGGNDGLRGLPVEDLARNLAAIVAAAQDRGIRVVLAGMEAPPNLGSDYTAAFRAVFVDVAERFDVPLIPFLLQGVAGVTDLNQSDGIHPSSAGAAIIADTLWTVLRPIAEESNRSQAGRESFPGS